MIYVNLCAGCGAIGGLFGDFKDSIDELLNETLRNGVNYIDTAYWYGQTRSEELLGQAIISSTFDLSNLIRIMNISHLKQFIISIIINIFSFKYFQALTKIPRHMYYISTRIGRFELDYSRLYDYQAHILLEQLTVSLERLKLANVDICYLQVYS